MSFDRVLIGNKKGGDYLKHQGLDGDLMLERLTTVLSRKTVEKCQSCSMQTDRRQTDRYYETNNPFLQFCENVRKNHLILCRETNLFFP
jgi:hypothetical protein